MKNVFLSMQGKTLDKLKYFLIFEIEPLKYLPILLSVVPKANI